MAHVLARRAEEMEATMATLWGGGAMAHTAVVAAAAGAPLGERFAALSAAVALGERTRDAGGHALVVLDDISCMVRALSVPLLRRPAVTLPQRPVARGVEAIRIGRKSWLWTSHGCCCLPAKALPVWARRSGACFGGLRAPPWMLTGRQVGRDRRDD